MSGVSLKTSACLSNLSLSFKFKQFATPLIDDPPVRLAGELPLLISGLKAVAQNLIGQLVAVDHDGTHSQLAQPTRAG